MWRPTEVGEVFAERRFAFELGARAREVRLVIGRPVKGPAERDPWWCPVHIGEPFDTFKAIPGEDSMQCLVLALEHANDILPDLARQKSGRAEWLGEHERLIFAGSASNKMRWRAVGNLVDGLADAVSQFEKNRPASPALLSRLRAVVASCGASVDPKHAPSPRVGVRKSSRSAKKA